MSRWFRFYDDAINDPKILKLPEAMRWHWTAFLCVASKHEGAIPPLDDLAILLRVTPAKATEIITILVKAGLLDKRETGYAPHNWDGRQYKSDVSTDRVKRFRNGKRNVSPSVARNVSETAPETDTDTETDISEAKASGADAPPDPSIAEREFFARGKQILGKSAGGQLAKLKAAKGGNIALARAALEAASQAQNPSEYIAGVIRAGPSTAKPLTEFQRKQQETNDARQQMRESAFAIRGGGHPDGILSNDHSKRPENLSSGPGQRFLELRATPPARSS